MKKYVIRTDLPKNIPLLFKNRADNQGTNNLQAAKNTEGKYEYFTYKQVYNSVISAALALDSLGVKKGDNVALISDNRKEWLITDLAIQSLGGADVPRGCDSMGNEIRFIINFADCTTGFFENEKQILKVLENVKEVPLLKTVILYDLCKAETETKIKEAGFKLVYFKDLMETGTKLFAENPDEKENFIIQKMNAVEPEDTATIIFTSGTTGTPKGVMLSHNNYISQLSAAENFMPGKQGEWWMTILPVWHSFERLAQYMSILIGCGLAYSKPIARTLLADMAEIKPRWMCGVPRLWDALTAGVNKTMEKQGGITYKIYKFFMKAGKKYADYKDKVTANVYSEKKRSHILDFITGLIPFIALYPLHLLGTVLVYNKIKTRFGGRFCYAISGGGAMQKDTDNFFRTINLTMLDGYGMTETAPSIAFRDYKKPQTGCIGKPFPTIQVKIVKEQNGQIADNMPLPPGQKGLILVKGAHVMKGYYKRPDLTEKIIDKDGWLNTGDIGLFTFNNDIKITGRAKDTIVLLDGENIEPVEIEQALCSSEFIESAMVVGQDKKFLSSLIVPSKTAIEAYAKQNNIKYETYEKLLKSELIYKLILQHINRQVSMEKGFRNCEKITKFTLIAKSFEVGKELSAKQEMMRYKITQEYNAEIESMYA